MMSMLVTNGLVSVAVSQPIALATHHSHRKWLHSKHNITLTVCSRAYPLEF